MATSTFPALSIAPPQPQDYVGQFAKIVALRNALQTQQFQQQLQPLQLQQEQQAVAIQQQQVKDIQAGQQSFDQWDGKDYGNLAKLFVQNGGSISGANSIAMYGLNQAQKHAQTLKARQQPFQVLPAPPPPSPADEARNTLLAIQRTNPGLPAVPNNPLQFDGYIEEIQN